MREELPEFLLDQAARCRRLAAGVTDQKAAEVLTRLAAEFEARAASPAATPLTEEMQLPPAS